MLYVISIEIAKFSILHSECLDWRKIREPEA